MSNTPKSAEPQFSPYFTTMIEWLFPDAPPEDLLVSVQQAIRPNVQASKHGYPLGFAKVFWRKREQLTTVFSKRISSASRTARIEYVLKQNAIIRALDSERLLGSFHWVDDPFPVEMLDQTAANLLHWLHYYGYDLIPNAPFPDHEYPDIPMPNPLVFDPNLQTVVRGRAPSRRTARVMTSE